MSINLPLFGVSPHHSSNIFEGETSKPRNG